MDDFNAFISTLNKEIKEDIYNYIKTKWGNVCDIIIDPEHQIYVVSPNCGDWEALYIDGKLFAEGHSLLARDIFDSLTDVFPNKYHCFEISDERAEEGFPEKISDLDEYKFELIKEN